MEIQSNLKKNCLTHAIRVKPGLSRGVVHHEYGTHDSLQSLYWNFSLFFLNHCKRSPTVQHVQVSTLATAAAMNIACTIAHGCPASSGSFMASLKSFPNLHLDHSLPKTTFLLTSLSSTKQWAKHKTKQSAIRVWIACGPNLDCWLGESLYQGDGGVATKYIQRSSLWGWWGWIYL